MKKIISKFIATLCVLGLLSYFIYHIYSAISPNLVTETAYDYTLNNCIRKNGFIIRDEELIESNVKGVKAYAVLNGTRIAQGETVVKIYGNEAQASYAKQIEDIDAEIKVLENLQGTSNVVWGDIDSINILLNEKLVHLSKELEKDEISRISDTKKQLLELLNKKQIVTGEAVNFSDRIQKLKKEREDLKASLSGGAVELKSPKPGYFISNIDGFEGIVKTSDAKSLDIPKFNELLKEKQSETKNGTIGKIVENFKWYIALKVSKDDIASLPSKPGLRINIPSASLYSIPAAVESVNYDSDMKEAVLVLSCSYMSKDLSAIRTPQVEIRTKSYTGLRINSKAVRIINGVKGVYVVIGSQIKFKELDVLYSGNGFVISALNIEDNNKVKLYDQIVVEGKELYDGKFIK